MASLAQITKETRIIAKIATITAVVVLLLFLVFKGGTFIKNWIFPTPPTPADQKFGQLSPIAFPSSSQSVPEYRINTVSGSLPFFATKINVYTLKKLEPNIIALQTGRTRTASLGYTSNQQAISQSEYRWNKPSSSNSLFYNIVNLNFSVTSSFLNNPTLQILLPDKGETTSSFTGFIDALGADRSDIDITTASFSYYTTNQGNFTLADSPSLSSVTRVDLFQNPVDKIPIYYPYPNFSTLYFIISNSIDNPEVLEAKYTHFTPNLKSVSTYYLKTTDAAFEDLKNGKGYIVNPTTDPVVDITEVSLGYYLSDDTNQTYLLPILVFGGKNNFEAYVQAFY